MTDYKAIVNALYEYHKTWRGVAEACGNEYARAYYWRIAKGKIRNLSDAGQRGVKYAYNQLTRELQPVTQARGKTRTNVSIRNDNYNRLLVIKNKHDLTWNGVVEMLLEGRE